MSWICLDGEKGMFSGYPMMDGELDLSYELGRHQDAPVWYLEWYTTPCRSDSRYGMKMLLKSLLGYLRS